MNVRWTEKATADLLAIHEYIAEQSLNYADAVADRILDRPRQLREHPRSGAIVPEYGREDVRELLIHSFRLIYLLEADEIRVVAVIHGSRRLQSDRLEDA